MVHICLQQFRVDILGSTRSEISVDHQEEALRGKEPFCYEYFEEVTAGTVYTHLQNRLCIWAGRNETNSNRGNEGLPPSRRSCAPVPTFTIQLCESAIIAERQDLEIVRDGHSLQT